jgi:hypothetical protein
VAAWLRAERDDLCLDADGPIVDRRPDLPGIAGDDADFGGAAEGDRKGVRAWLW